MNRDLHIEFDFDQETGIYSFIVRLDGKTLHIDMDTEQFESISNSMVRMIKDVNLMQARKYQAKIDNAN